MPFIIYKITNDVNPKVYIGCTMESLERRWKAHKSNAASLTPYQTPTLSLAIHTIGVQHFTIEVIESCTDREMMLDRERYWIRNCNSLEPNGYNTALRKLSDEQIAILKTNQYNLTRREYAALFGVSVSTIQVYARHG